MHITITYVHRHIRPSGRPYQSIMRFMSQVFLGSMKHDQKKHFGTLGECAHVREVGSAFSEYIHTSIRHKQEGIFPQNLP